MQTAAINAQLVAPITPGQVAEVATAELAASLALLNNLDESDWAAPTDCAGWTVHELTAHLAGPVPGAWPGLACTCAATAGRTGGIRPSRA
jgi:hypothetical protein